MSTRRRVWLLVVVCIAVVVAVNPVTTSALWPGLTPAAYAAAVDLWFLAIAACILVRSRSGAGLGRMLAVVALATPVVLLGAELAITVARNRIAGSTGVPSGLYRVSRTLGWDLQPGAVAKHVLPGSFDVEYMIDDRGLRVTPRPDEGRRQAVHVFGDSFAFGVGVNDSDAALAIVAARMPSVHVLNYGVPGYGLVQMLGRLAQHRQAVAAGDLVVFLPLSEDLLRGLLYREAVCGIYWGRSKAGAVGTYPALRDGRLETQSLRPACASAAGLLWTSALPAGRLFKLTARRRDRPELLRHADRVLAAARSIVDARGARFRLVFVASAGECEAGAHVFDPSDLDTPFRSMLGSCPPGDDAARALRFPGDGHWSTGGNRWAAEVLHRMIGSEIDTGSPPAQS